MNDKLVWIDCEMTGLDLHTDALIEVAALVTDAELNVLGDGIQVVIKPPEQALEQMSDFVRGMHANSGLLPLLESGLEMAEAEEKVLDYIRAHVPEVRRAPLAGNTIGTDRAFLARDMPTLEAHVHYRNVDVSSLKELARRWYPRTYHKRSGQERQPSGTGRHHRVDRGAALLPRSTVRPDPRPRHRRAARDRGSASGFTGRRALGSVRRLTTCPYPLGHTRCGTADFCSAGAYR